MQNSTIESKLIKFKMLPIFKIIRLTLVTNIRELIVKRSHKHIKICEFYLKCSIVKYTKMLNIKCKNGGLQNVYISFKISIRISQHK